MTLTDISKIRLISQKIEGSEFNTAKEIVSCMGAMQAQDFPMSKWAIGTRLLNSTEAKIEEAIDKGEIIRTHLMRPTWHFVSADDVYWMLELTAPRIKTSMRSRHIHLELTEEAVIQGMSLIENVFIHKENVTREEIAKEFDRAKIKTDDNRLAHFLLLAELEGIICSGKISNNKPTYALLSERVPYKKILTREESLGELAKRYFISHCPATEGDFSWWSGLSLKDARRGLELVKSDFISEKLGEKIYWLNQNSALLRKNNPSVYLLPAYDEFLISYRDRNVSLSAVNNKRTVSANGIFRPVLVVNGQVSGLWKRSTVKNKVIIEITLFRENNLGLLQIIEGKVSEYGRFLNKETEIVHNQ